MEDVISQNKIEELDKQVSEQRKKLSSDRIDLSFGEIINLYKNDELIILPEYKRLYRWTSKQKTAFIESILLSIPIPPIFVVEDETGIWELMDGLQRIATIISFFGELKTDISTLALRNSDEDNSNQDEEINLKEEGEISLSNKWTLEAGDLLADLEGFNIDTLSKKYQLNLKRAVCRVEILRGDNVRAMKYELFQRLNSGSSKLTPQEIRNAFYKNVNPILDNLISELSQTLLFKQLTALSKQKRLELYDQELILRFIAFYNNVESINEDAEIFLNSFIEKNVENEQFDHNFYKTIFLEVLELIDQLNDENVFRNHKNLFVPAYFEGITIGVAQNINHYKNNISLLSNKIEELKKDDSFKKYSGSASNSKSRIKNRLTRANQIFSDLSID